MRIKTARMYTEPESRDPRGSKRKTKWPDNTYHNFEEKLLAHTHTHRLHSQSLSRFASIYEYDSFTIHCFIYFTRGEVSCPWCFK